MTDPSHRTQVVGDVEQAHSRPLVEMRKKAQYFRLRNNVERTGRLVRNQEGWIVDNCHRDDTRCAFIVYSSWVQMGFANRREAKTIPVDALEGFPIVALHRTFRPVV